MKTKDAVAEKIKVRTLDFLVAKKGLDLGEFVIENLGVDVMLGLYDNRILYCLYTLIPAEDVKEETHTLKIEYPSDWKQAFKEAHFPEWLKKLYPVKYKRITETVNFTAYDIFPHFPLSGRKYNGESVRQIRKTVIERNA